MEIVLILVALAVVLLFFFLKKGKTPPSTAPTSLPAEQAPRTSASPERETVAREKEKAVEPTLTESSVATSPAPAPETEAELSPEETTQELSAEDLLDGQSSEEELETVASPPPPPVRGTPGPAQVESAVDLQSLRKGLAKSRQAEGFFGKLRQLLGGRKEISQDISAEIEEVLLTSDVGVRTTERIISALQARLARGELASEERVWEALREEAERIVSVGGRSGGIQIQHTPTVVLLVGVNGAGKTTTIGKLAKKFQAEGKSVMLAAGDTFRAAAVDQLKAWGERTGAPVIAGKSNADPSSVLFDAVQAAREQKVDILLADTAGRLHTKTNLMQEMTKIARTASKALEGAPHEVLLVIDSTNGQNALAQAKEFQEALPLSGLVLTKLDGTARGGVVLGICDTLQVPVRYIGLGERAEDLHEFSASGFVEALLGREKDEVPV